MHAVPAATTAFKKIQINTVKVFNSRDYNVFFLASDNYSSISCTFFNFFSHIWVTIHSSRLLYLIRFTSAPSILYLDDVV